MNIKANKKKKKGTSVLPGNLSAGNLSARPK